MNVRGSAHSRVLFNSLATVFTTSTTWRRPADAEEHGSHKHLLDPLGACRASHRPAGCTARADPVLYGRSHRCARTEPGACDVPDPIDRIPAAGGDRIPTAF